MDPSSHLITPMSPCPPVPRVPVPSSPVPGVPVPPSHGSLSPFPPVPLCPLSFSERVKGSKTCSPSGPVLHVYTCMCTVPSWDQSNDTDLGSVQTECQRVNKVTEDTMTTMPMGHSTEGPWRPPIPPAPLAYCSAAPRRALRCLIVVGLSLFLALHNMFVCARILHT